MQQPFQHKTKQKKFAFKLALCQWQQSDKKKTDMPVFRLVFSHHLSPVPNDSSSFRAYTLLLPRL